MKDYIRAELTVTEFEAEDVITTSGVPSGPNKTYSIDSPNYHNEQSVGGWNWTLWQ